MHPRPDEVSSFPETSQEHCGNVPNDCQGKHEEARKAGLAVKALLATDAEHPPRLPGSCHVRLRKEEQAETIVARLQILNSPIARSTYSTIAPTEEPPSGDEDTAFDQLKGWANNGMHASHLKHPQQSDNDASQTYLTPPQQQTKTRRCAKAQNGSRREVPFPPPHQCCDKDFKASWSLADSGSAEDVADHAKHVPGAKLSESAARKEGQTFTAANG